MNKEPNIFYTEKEAFEEWIKDVREKNSRFNHSIAQCPNCGQLSVFIDVSGASFHSNTWVDAVYWDLDGYPMGLSKCQDSGGGNYIRNTYAADNIKKGTWETTQTAKSGECACDFDTVIMTIGCQCGSWKDLSKK